ncbi:hypothetical protein [Variovorax sp. YR216]|uniref:hypothetical protein n=1 Tax=Variovorax sp. YR216 TaxID=1882828 RepID=UPI00089BA6A4|nr:hypothetical protein [Variovorax sp. YR216]SEB26329.1 hypothetical protein SAMN05444680_13125 [Variovorax sp. YR216]
MSLLKNLFTLVKIITAPFWLPSWLTLWLLRKGWRLLLLAFVVSAASGCTSLSNKFDKSPCACDFRPLNTIALESTDHA